MWHAHNAAESQQLYLLHSKNLTWRAVNVGPCLVVLVSPLISLKWPSHRYAMRWHFRWMVLFQMCGNNSGKPPHFLFPRGTAPCTKGFIKQCHCPSAVWNSLIIPLGALTWISFSTATAFLSSASFQVWSKTVCGSTEDTLGRICVSLQRGSCNRMIALI